MKWPGEGIAFTAEVRFLPVSFQGIYYYDSNKSTGKETGKTHLCEAENKVPIPNF